MVNPIFVITDYEMLFHTYVEINIFVYIWFCDKILGTEKVRRGIASLTKVWKDLAERKDQVWYRFG